jgi:hypothetical protein
MPVSQSVAEENGIRQSMPARKAGYARDGLLWPVVACCGLLWPVVACCGPLLAAMMKAIPGRSIGDRNGDMKIVVASASGPNGNGHGKLLPFSGDDAPLGAFSDDVAAFRPDLDGVGAPILRRGIAPLPRGSAFAADDTLFLASGV